MNPKRINLFIQSQNRVWEKVLKEMKNGKKETHWIWYIFPQIKGLSLSENGVLYSLDSVDEAKEYLKQPILKERLFTLLNIIKDLDSNDIFEVMGGEPDNFKFAASMTIFELADPDETLFKDMFDKFSMERDQYTIDCSNGIVKENSKNNSILASFFRNLLKEE